MLKKDKILRFNLTFVIVGFVILLIVAQLIITHNLATQGEKLRQSERRIGQLEQMNLILAEEISGAGSLSQIVQEAEKLGLTKSGQVLYLTPQVPVALGKPGQMR